MKGLIYVMSLLTRLLLKQLFQKINWNGWNGLEHCVL